MSKYPANKIFPAKVKKAIFYSYVQYVAVRGYAYDDIAGKTFSQIDVDYLFSTTINLIIEYALDDGITIGYGVQDSSIEDELEEVRDANTYDQCVVISNLLDNFLSDDAEVEVGYYGGTETGIVLEFAPKFVEIMDILRSGEVYKGLKMS